MKHEYGFTLTELIVALGVFGLLIGLSTVSLVHFGQRASLNSTVTTFIADIKEQQTKAMVGDTEGSGTPSSFGVHILSTSYVLFRGASYTSGAAGNFTVSLPNNEQFSNAGTDIIFSRLSGETGNSSTITVNDTTNQDQKILSINKYGVVTSVN